MIFVAENRTKQFESDIAKAVDKIFDKEKRKGEKQLEKNIRISLIGNVNTGKSSTINALVGEDVLDTYALPGETVNIIEVPHPDDRKIVFVDTPGLNDINARRSRKALRDVKNADVVLYFLNAEGVVLGKNELDSLDKISKGNKNVIVVLNKIDGIEADDVSAIKRHVERTIEERFKVIPISAKTGENIDKLNGVILDFLSERGKDILFARNSKVKSVSAHKWISGAAISASAIGALPLPGADIVPLTTLQVALIVKLSLLYDKPIIKSEATAIIVATIAGGLGQNVFRQGVKFFPGLGSVIGASVAGVITFALGQAVKYAFENDIDITPDNLKNVMDLVKK